MEVLADERLGVESEEDAGALGGEGLVAADHFIRVGHWVLGEVHAVLAHAVVEEGARVLFVADRLLGFVGGRVLDFHGCGGR